ncbi:MAG: histidine--tRNA ligase [Lentisphaeria bacterium]|nr:histidine--tRNA ligase [Lentisphaeria bacterium]
MFFPGARKWKRWLEVGGDTGFFVFKGTVAMPGKMEPLPGTSDIWFPEVSAWADLETVARETFALYGYGELRTPVFERTDVFVKGIGDQTEVVQKEMYTFEDRGGRSLTLRPEGTAGVMRAIANQGVDEGTEKRVFYMGPMFRGERPAAGRKRQFHQIGVETVGRFNPAVDAECVAMLADFLERAGIGQTRILINSRGTSADRERVVASLTAYFQPLIGGMCGDCQRRLGENVWRILDCKAEECQTPVAGAPAIVDLLGADSQAFFRQVCQYLDAQGVTYDVAPRLVRGLDYYEHTVFEVVSEAEHLGAQNAVAGGGRYSIPLAGLKKPMRGVGFAAGMERLLLARGVVEMAPADLGAVDVYVAAVGNEALPAGLAFAKDLRRDALRVLAETDGRSLKAQLRTANRVGAKVVVILGGNELANGTALIRNMADSRQEEVAAARVAETVKAFLR